MSTAPVNQSRSKIPPAFSLACPDECMLKDCPLSPKTGNQQEKRETRAGSYFSYHHNVLMGNCQGGPPLMRKLFLLFAIILVCAPAGFAQSDYSDWEFFVGYAHERANNGADRLDARGRIINANGTTQPADFISKRIPYNGVTTEVVANVHRNIGL